MTTNPLYGGGLHKSCRNLDNAETEGCTFDMTDQVARNNRETYA
ncbi:hypothetical protein [Oleidesulfovibrio sp.]